MADKAARSSTQASTKETHEHELRPTPTGIAMPSEVADAHDTQQVASADAIAEAHCGK